ncbi:proteasome assembly chaperone family protein [Candidatus Bathyarchaeota archaeon]|nr:MAG: proteasome assembly chaperone family protein [Candidatus Bathyarchaeota archaeon]
MKETVIVELEKVDLKKPVLLEGLPGLGTVGKIVADYIIKETGAKKFAELYSPHFSYFVLVDDKGDVRLLRNEFYAWKNESGGSDLIILTGDSQAQTVEGQYEIADRVLEFAREKGVELVITVGGYRNKVTGVPRVIAASTSREVLSRAIDAGAINSPTGSPIVGAAGILVGLANLKGMKALCLLGETLGYMPDPKAAKSVIKVLMKLLNFKIDLTEIEKEIVKSEEAIEKIKAVEAQKRLTLQKRKEIEKERITYIG